MLKWFSRKLPLEEAVRPFPGGYRRMLAINSDVEWTSWPAQQRLIELAESRSLETAFSYWFFANPAVTWRFFEEDGARSENAKAAFELARAGKLDTLHSFGGRRHAGGCSYDRGMIERAYEAFAGEGVVPKIYSNHGGTDDKQNVGGDWGTYHEGDIPDSPYYHLDLTRAAGVEFFWCDPDYTVDEPWLRVDGEGETPLWHVAGVRDGTEVLRFRRFMGRLEQGCCLTNFADQVEQALDSDREGYCVIYQHLGVVRDGEGRPGEAPVEKLEERLASPLDRLRAAQEDGDCLVATTERLLRHAFLMASRPWTFHESKDRVDVDFDRRAEFGGIGRELGWDDLAGWTIRARDRRPVVARLNGESRELTPAVGAGAGRLLSLPWGIEGYRAQ